MGMMVTINDMLEAARAFTSSNMVDMMLVSVAAAGIAILLALFTLLRHRVPSKVKREIQELQAGLARQQAYHERYMLDRMRVEPSRGIAP